jgi:YbgC/YbaW family acyl-CoA thioester hydrolase
MEYKRKIFGYECDVYGHLNNANYLHVYEEARADALEQMDISVEKFLSMNFQIYVTEISVQYKKGIPMGTKIKIETKLKKSNRVSSVWVQEIYDESGDLCSTAEVKGVFVSNGKPKRIDKKLYQHILSYL